RAGGARGESRRGHPGAGVPDRLAAARRQLARRAGDGAPGERQPGDGRALRGRGAGDHRHVHPRLAVVTLPAGALRPSRPRAARWVAGVLLGLTVLGAPTLFVVLAVNDLRMSPPDVYGTILVVVVLGWLCWRQAAVRAVPDDAGLTVRNFIRVRRLTWAQI